MKLEALPWLILFLPLLAAAVITLFTRHKRNLSAGISIGAVVTGFGLSLIFVKLSSWQPNPPETAVTWLALGDFKVDLGLRFDPLSLLMLLIVTGVASAIHIYSWGYMRDDRGFSRYFACLSLFTFSMLGIVLANNFIELFIFWELVGVSSYLLIGFWFERPAAADAGKKAFLTNRLGDFGFLLGILTVWSTLRSLNFADLRETLAAHPQALGPLATVAGLLIFCGAMGKSAQFPLHVWLPDAMEGPTPVSALIHAATMVAAGVYMLCRVFFLLDIPGSHALEVISWVGGITAMLSAVIAVQQNDIKRILAYSTLSQLGYMVMGVGLGGPTQAMFHLTTHAFFKALLFLGAGSIILALHHEQDIWKMGGLRQKMPTTFWTFLVGTLALAGIPPLSGFYSKDVILALAAEQHAYGRFVLGAAVAVLTAFYMFRLVFVVFFSAPRSESPGHARESPAVITWPLKALAVFSIVAGFIGVENLYRSQFGAVGTERAVTTTQQIAAPFVEAPLAAGFGILAAAIGMLAAYSIYAKAAADPLPEKLGALSRAMRNRFYFDEFYEATFIRFHDLLAAVAAWIDRWIIGGLVTFTHGTTELTGRALRLLQTGNLQAYAFLFAFGVALVLFLVLR
ncbi:MAG TPA: NADH-quinone oxidoreductase subunit L [Candidatus Binatia bacterium]|jgi:NADH-quinone oxidoreductase subunit L|nr:NADH-quinone oxidoreductase subunit L [Candidatus Binatia bacterium]